MPKSRPPRRSATRPPQRDGRTVPPGALPPDLAEIEQMALQTLAAFPEPFRSLARQVALLVEEFARDEVLDDLGITDPFELSGLYDGIPLPEKSGSEQVLAPDTVWLFRRAILDEWVARGDIALDELVAHVTIHEFAHHFGWSDAEIARIAPWQY